MASFCKFCGIEIVWAKEGRKNVPLTLNGEKHRCEEMKNALKSVKEIKPSTLSPEEIAKYEKAINSKN